MAYTLNSAKDAAGNEDQFVADFAANQPAIVAYKQQHGGDLEGAYQAVTGKPWPAGRSVKIKDGRVEMTKDRTVRSVLGKYVLPAAAAVIAPYAIGALAGGGAAAGGATAAGGAGAAGAGAGAGTAAGVGGAVAGGSSLWKSLLPTIIGGAATVGGAAIAAHGNSEASKAAAEQADKALAIQQQQYALQRQDTAPYRALGQGAVGNLGFLAGIDLPQEKITALSSTVPTQQPPPLPTQSTPPVTGRLTPPGYPAPTGQAVPRGQGLIPMRSPQGTVHLIPPQQVEAARANGGQPV